jgi:anthranilate phosphoribosyltransferase
MSTILPSFIHWVGLEEISPLRPATFTEIRNRDGPDDPKQYEERVVELYPLGVGIPRCELRNLKGGGPKENSEKHTNRCQAECHRLEYRYTLMRECRVIHRLLLVNSSSWIFL